MASITDVQTDRSHCLMQSNPQTIVFLADSPYDILTDYLLTYLFNDITISKKSVISVLSNIAQRADTVIVAWRASRAVIRWSLKLSATSQTLRYITLRNINVGTLATIFKQVL